jgi:hypothetical protein
VTRRPPALYLPGDVGLAVAERRVAGASFRIAAPCGGLRCGGFGPVSPIVAMAALSAVLLATFVVLAIAFERSPNRSP